MVRIVPLLGQERSSAGARLVRVGRLFVADGGNSAFSLFSRRVMVASLQGRKQPESTDQIADKTGESRQLSHF